MDTVENVKFRDKKSTGISINIADTFELSEKEFENLSIIERLKAIWNEKYMDVNMLKYSHFLGMALYLYVSISGLIVLRNYVVQEMVLDDESIYWYKVIFFYLWYITTAHWLCVLLYNSYWSPEDEDQIILVNKTLWDDYDQTLQSMTPKRIFEDTKEKSSAKCRMLKYIPNEVTGLRWRYCLVCQRDAPPRAHHCVVCNRCILKRDHHCFMTGRCIGFMNQRYFYFFCLFCVVSSVVMFFYEGRYLFINDKIHINNSWPTLFLPITVYKWIWLREVSGHVVIIISHLYICPLIAAMCFAFVALQSLMILRGITSEEMKHGARMKVNLGFVQRWQEVFGEWSILNFIMPSQILFRQPGDGEHWPGLVNLDVLTSLKDLRIMT